MLSRKQIIIIYVALAVYLAISFLLWWAWGWLPGISPTVALILAEYIAEVYKYKTLKIPMVARLQERIKRKKVVLPAEVAADNRAAIVLNSPTPALPQREGDVMYKVVTSISDIKAYDFFITCIAKKDFAPVGTGTHEQLQEAFNKLLSDYYEVKNDDRMRMEIKLRRELVGLQLHMGYVKAMAEVLKSVYIPVAAEGLRKAYPRYELTPVTYRADLEMIGKAEISKSMEYDRKKTQLEKLYANGNKKNPGTKAQNMAVQNEKSFVRTVMDINSVTNSRHEPRGITLMEYAIGEEQLKQHIDNLKDVQNGR